MIATLTGQSQALMWQPQLSSSAPNVSLGSNPPHPHPDGSRNNRLGELYVTLFSITGHTRCSRDRIASPAIVCSAHVHTHTRKCVSRVWHPCYAFLLLFFENKKTFQKFDWHSVFDVLITNSIVCRSLSGTGTQYPARLNWLLSHKRLSSSNLYLCWSFSPVTFAHIRNGSSSNKHRKLCFLLPSLPLFDLQRLAFYQRSNIRFKTLEVSITNFESNLDVCIW